MVIAKGNALKLGCEKTGRSYNFAFANEQEKIYLLIYNRNREMIKRIELDESYKTGSVFACEISGVNLDKALYCYEAEGELIVDPYAKTVTDCEEFGVERENPLYLSRVCLEDFNWEGDRPLNIPYEDCIFYKMHVRGFTKSKTSGVKNKGTFTGVVQKIPYLKELGITTVELMPAYEFDDCKRFKQLDKVNGKGIYTSAPVKCAVNYWGYVDGFTFAPKAAYCACASTKKDYTTEFKTMVRELHKAGIEVVMEMHFVDKTPDFILDCVKYWVMEYHIDGVHYYGSVEGLKAIAADHLLSKTKIITVYWDGEAKGFKHMANCNSGCANTLRKFLKGDENQLAAYASVARDNPANAANINYITNHDGFTLADLVGYDRKHNEANGENNKDGENFNNSWNCGIEGATRLKKVVQLRQKQIKNAFAMLLLSAGTPLILAGDEFGNSQSGNNNPYCVDSELSWVNWKKNAEANMIRDYVKSLIAYRRDNSILHKSVQLMASASYSGGFPDISYHGTSAWYQPFESYERHMGIMYCTKCSNDKYEEYKLIYVAYNMHWEEHELALPTVNGNEDFKLVLCSAQKPEDVVLTQARTVRMTPRTVALLECNFKITGKNNKSNKNISKNIDNAGGKNGHH